MKNLKKILKDHKLWTEGNPAGVKANLRGADLQGADLREADLQGANLREADLQGANLQGAYLQWADLQEIDLQDAYLQETYLQGADLREANLRGADLQGADLREADLQGADLREADLQGADLREANLQGADLWGANLQGAYLQRSDLWEVKLWNIKGTDAYCTILATDSKGQWVVEMKGSGEVKSVAPDALEEVVPYTVDVVFMDGYKFGSQRYAYTSKEGLFKEGDILFLNNGIAKVAGVGTKSTQATKELKATRLVTEAVG